jgi:hypothetical protein
MRVVPVLIRAYMLFCPSHYAAVQVWHIGERDDYALVLRQVMTVAWHPRWVSALGAARDALTQSIHLSSVEGRRLLYKAVQTGSMAITRSAATIVFFLVDRKGLVTGRALTRSVCAFLTTRRE